MSSLSDDTLRKILMQIQTTAANAHKNLGATRQQITVKERERRILQLTIEEITGLDQDVNLYKGVGKMFMMEPRPTMEKSLKDDEKTIADDLTNLGKKAKYLEKQFTDAQNQLRDIFNSAPRQ